MFWNICPDVSGALLCLVPVRAGGQENGRQDSPFCHQSIGQRFFGF